MSSSTTDTQKFPGWLRTLPGEVRDGLLAPVRLADGRRPSERALGVCADDLIAKREHHGVTRWAGGEAIDPLAGGGRIGIDPV